MGKLKPGAEYIYTYQDGTVYQREKGTFNEEAIGWNYDSRSEDGKPLVDEIRDAKLWGNIRRESKVNPLLKEALDRVIMIYHLSKNDGEK